MCACQTCVTALTTLIVVQDSKTKVIKHNLEPHWEEAFNFQMDLEGNGPDRLVLKVLDWNMVMQHHLMGEASVKLRDIVVKDTGVSEHMWIDLYRTGTS